MFFLHAILGPEETIRIKYITKKKKSNSHTK